MNNKITPRDFFLHLGATVALYVAAGSLINLAFSLINYWKPDELAGYFYGGSIALPMAILIIVTPILYILEWVINKDIRVMPEKKDLWIRRWRIFLTLFLAVVVLGGDLISLLNTYFNGEITARFVYKVVAVLLVAGAIGKYYFFSLYENARFAGAARRINIWAGIILVLAAIVCGFIVVGPPTKQRDLRFDAERINDLSNIQWQVISYYQRKEALPNDLDDLIDAIQNPSIPTDPETKVEYEYANKGNAFELCAVFALPTPDIKGRGEYYGGRGGVAYPMMIDSSYPYPEGDAWKHEAGRVCFDRPVDPERFPPYPKERLNY